MPINQRAAPVLTLLFLFAVCVTTVVLPPFAHADDVVRPPKPRNSLPPTDQTQPQTPESAPQATLTTDKEAYLPGEMVIISGGDFQTGEQIEVKIKLANGGYTTPWTVFTGNNGGFATYWYIPLAYPLGDAMTTEANGITSGLKAEAFFVSGNSILKWRTLIPDSVCPDGYFPACVCLTQSCDGYNTEPLPGRPIIFYFTTGTCDSADVAMVADTVWTDNAGFACTWLTAPSSPGAYTLRARYEAEPAPIPCSVPGNNVCDPYSSVEADRCVTLNGGSLCHTLNVTNSPNHPPTINFGTNVTVDMCVPTEICITYQLTDPEGIAGLHEENLSGFGEFRDPVNGIYFTPDTSGIYVLIAKTIDPCGAYDIDTVVISIDMNDPPSIAFGTDQSITDCEPGEICLPYSVSDPDGLAGSHEYLVSGPGTINTAADQVCFTPGIGGTYTFIVKIVDTCSLADYDTINVNVQLPNPPSIAFGPDTSITLCQPGQICLPYVVSDPDGLAGLLESQIAGPGTIDTLNNRVCFDASASGSFTIIARVTDSCGGSDQDTIVVNVTVGAPPTIAFGADFGTGGCNPMQICVPYTVSDPQGLAGLIEALVSGPSGAAIDTLNNRVCFTPSVSGVYTIIAKVTDLCGAEDRDTIRVSVNLNLPPVIAFGPDTSIVQCALSQVCVTYTINDPNGPAGLIESLVSGPSGSTLDAANNRVCFTPTGAANYTVIVKAMDPCNAFDLDTINITVTVNQPPTITLEPDKTLELCIAQNPVCVGYVVSNPDGSSGLIESLVSAPLDAVIDTVLSRICFSPTTTGTFTFIASVGDSCGADLDTSVVTITPSTPPVCNLPGNTAFFLCGSQQICLPASATADDVPVNCVVTSGVGSVVNGNWCYTPTTPGVFNVTITCTDACGATCSGSFQVVVLFNGPPNLTFGPDTSLFQCAPTLICLSYTVTDPDLPPKWTESIVSAPPGAILDTAQNRICFTPPSAGQHTIIVRATDSCGLFDQDTINVNVNLNDPPTISFGPDTSVSQCSPTQICRTYTVTDPDGLAGLIETKISGPGTLDTANNRICFTPTASGTVTLIAKVADPCGLFDLDTINVNVRLNSPPVCDLPRDTTIFQCQPTEVCLPVSATDPNGNFSQCMLMSGPGTLANGQWCYTPTGDQQVTVTIRCADSCSAFCEGTFSVNFVINDPPVCNVPGDTSLTFLCSLQTVSLPVGATDPNGNFKECVLVNSPGALVNGYWVFTPTGPGQYCVTIECRDSCDAVCQTTFCVTVNLETVDCDCIFKVSIGGGQPTDGLNGQAVVVPVVLEIADEQMGGFDLILCYDETGIFITQVAKGPSLAAWEYFTYRLGAFGNCTGNCPLGIVRLIGITDMNNGQPITDQNAWRPLGTIANLTFVITNDRNFIGQCVPITWCWYQCGDNSISSRTGDTLFIEVGSNYDSCQSNPKGDPIPGICFENGRICILEPPDDRGDLNLNGIANEIGDAVLYTNFFIYGQSVWSPIYKEVQWLASDINDDGIILTIADLVYLIRIITGDEQPFPPGGNPKLVSANPAVISTDVVGEALTLRWNSELAIGGAHFIVDLPSDATVGEVTLLPDVGNMTLRANRDGNQLRVLVFSDTTEIIPAGSHAIVSIAMSNPQGATVSTYDLSTEDGWVMPSILNTAKAIVPTEFSLAQNYPNPFNAGTVIRFGSNVATDYTVAIYDILGRRVWGVSGQAEAGWTEVPWDGRGDGGNDLASGLYLYRVQTATGVQTRKMTLLK